MFCLTFLLLKISIGTFVQTSDQCLECSLLTRKQDCIAINCFWELNQSTKTYTCQETSSINSNIQSYCQLNETVCSSTLGCAYIEEQCQQFAGCSAYYYNTTQECQAISSNCYSLGDGCTDILNCAKYKSQDICENTPNVSGSEQCKWDDDQCKDQTCTDASATLVTDLECEKFKSGCITTGYGCVSPPLLACSTYSSQNCFQMIGSDGQCEQLSGSENCILRTCFTASNTLSTDTDCNTYLQGCVTNGYGCVQVLSPCNTYQQNCAQYLGSDGICELDVTTNQCRSRICENGLFTDDIQCSNYKQGCISNGVNCVKTLQLCSQYNGTSITCLQYIGSDGKCKGIGDTELSCQVQDCIQDSNSLITTNEDCQKINTNCITNGYGCVYQLSSCSSYQQSAEICKQMIGSDGICQAGQNGYCSAISCLDAPNTYKTNSSCSSYLSNCVSNGNGCVEVTTCDLSIKQISCQGTSQCQWDSVCFDSSDCINFQTQAICENNQSIILTTFNEITSINYQPCVWKNNQCEKMLCSDLTVPTYNSDLACQQKMSWCVFGGQGCVQNDINCNQLNGTQLSCGGYAIKCWNDSSATSTTPCRDRTCSDNTTLTTDAQCSSFKNGCLTNGQGCIDDTKQCQDYQGTQQQCSNFSGYISGQSERQLCYNIQGATNTTNCVNRSCDMLTTASNNSQCSSFMSGCVWNGLTSCIQDNSNCTQFSGTKQQCSNFQGNKQTVNGITTYTQCDGLSNNTQNSSCKVRECSDNSIQGLSDIQCDSFLSGCLSNGLGCVSQTATCDQYSGTLTTCSEKSGNGKKCTRQQGCKGRVCSDLSNPTNQTDCQSYHSNCRFKNSQSTCINATSCNQYQAQGNNNSEKQQYCLDITNSQDESCGYLNGQSNCQDLTCDQITLQDECLQFNYQQQFCYFVNGECFSPQSCTNYIIDNTSSSKPITNEEKLTWCNQMVDANNIQCQYHEQVSTSTCTYFVICEQILTATSTIECNYQLYPDPLYNQKGCQYFDSYCYSTQQSCQDYQAIGADDNAKQQFCQAMRLNTAIGDSVSAQVIQCSFQNGNTNCSSANCETIQSPTSQSDCDAQAINCIYFNQVCYTKQDNCSSYNNSVTVLFCSFIINTAGNHCSYIDGMSNCVDPSTDCTLNNWTTNNGNPAPSPLPSNDSEKREYCRKRRNSDGRMCGYINGADSCNVENNYCEIIESPTSQSDCQIVSGCTYIQLEQKCVNTITLDSCTQILFDSNILTVQADIISYCDSVTSNNQQCTWLQSNGTCNDLLNYCSQYDISTSTNAAAIKYFCLSRVTDEGSCAWKEGDPFTVCRKFSCFDIQNPSTQENCNRVISGCSYYSGTCVKSQSDCSSYYASGANDLIKLSYCKGLKQLSDDSYCTFIMGQDFCTTQQSSCSDYDLSALESSDQSNWCSLLNDSTSKACIFSESSCVQFSCELITNITSQSDCDYFLTGCQYNYGNCFTIQQDCNQTEIPSYISSQIQFCSNIKNSNNEYCTYVDGDSNCSSSLSDCSYTAEGSQESDQISYCQARKNSNGIVCTFLSGSSTCSVANNACDLINDAQSQYDCYTFSSNCSYSYVEQICKDNLNSCSDYDLASENDVENNLSYCLSVSCTYVSGLTCEDLPLNCESYTIESNTSDKDTFCYERKDQQGMCVWDQISDNCSSISCDLITNAQKEIDCQNYSNQCHFYQGSCVTQNSACDEYYPSGNSLQDIIVFCQGLTSSDNIQCTYLYGDYSCSNTRDCTLYDVSTYDAQSSLVICNLMSSQQGQCTYIDGLQTCSNVTCDLIINLEIPTSQSKCDFYVPGQCKYYDGQCYQILDDCTSYDAGTTDQLIFCQTRVDSQGHFCSYNTGSNCSQYSNDCTDINVTGNDASTKRQFCRKYKTGENELCDYRTGNTCEVVRNYCDLIDSPTSQEYCDQRMLNCIFIQAQNLCIESYKVSQCSDLKFDPSYNDKIIYCQGISILNCTWINATDHCEDNTTQCSDFDASGQSDKSNYCSQIISSTGQCAWKQGDSSNYCREFQCQDIVNPVNQSDCDLIKLGCSFYVNQCFTEQTHCNNYYAGTDSILSQIFCNGITTTSGEQCAYQIGQNYCQIRTTCTDYLYNDTETCQRMFDSDGNQCIYVNGTTCQVFGTCESYIGDIDNCSSLFDINYLPCIQDTNTCISIQCENIGGAVNQQSCDDVLEGQCLFLSGYCFTIQESCSSYSTYGANAIIICAYFINQNGQFCTADQINDTSCRERLCSEKSFQSNSDCFQWSNKCKSNGQQCIDMSIQCSTFSGDSNVCSQFLDTDNLNKCTVNQGSENSVGTCSATDLTCDQNTTSTTNQDCSSYLYGCLTKGVGCIDQTATCDQYYGTKSQCAQFTGYVNTVQTIIIREGCSANNSNSVNDKCRSRVCSDNVTDVTDANCILFKSGCLTNGQGCIEKSSPCSMYSGTQTQCSQFMGSNQTIYCWNVSSATSVTPCTEKQCTDIKETTDQNCFSAQNQLIIDSQNQILCVTNGQNCINNPASCSDFQGDENACSQFTANNDGPCMSTQSGYCAARDCTLAPSTYTTDAQCQGYHTNCLTTGAGCMKYTQIVNGVKQLSCNNNIVLSACSPTNSCGIISYCTELIVFETCASVVPISNCSNTTLRDGSYCFYDTQTSVCRPLQCQDQSFTITEHSVCNLFSSTCTTSGAGCIEMSQCINYTTQLICQSAYSTDQEIRCTWENKQCRVRECQDSNGTTDDECNSFLSGCITNGAQCISSQYQCSDLLQENCITDYQGQPCAYAASKCWTYKQCTDLSLTTHLTCYSFNKYCTSDGTTCIPLTKCEDYKKSISCIIGIDGSCGWMNSKCMLFTSCSQLKGTTLSNCQSFNQICVSDGVQCVEQSTCEDYVTEYACTNSEGTDGKCEWDNNQCRLQVCEDIVLTKYSYSNCKQQLSTGCTYNGKTCISLSTCDQYDLISCYEGTDGDCVYKLPSNIKNSNVTCRIKTCEDVQGTTALACSSPVNGIECTSNGTNCISKQACAQYTTSVACSGGGTDGDCIFILNSDNSTDGTCQRFTKCSDANNDQSACVSKSSFCNWEKTSYLTQCTPHNCTSYNKNSSCLPVPSFDGKTYTLCAKINNICSEITLSQLTIDTCYINSQFTGLWNSSIQKCQYCKVTNNNTTNVDNGNNQTNQNSTNTTTEYNAIISFISWIIVAVTFEF